MYRKFIVLVMALSGCATSHNACTTNFKLGYDITNNGKICHYRDGKCVVDLRIGITQQCPYMIEYSCLNR